VNAVRLALGTLTVLPVRPPAVVDRRVAGLAMALAPLVGLVLAAAVGAPVALAVAYADAAPLLLAGLAVGALAVLTRAIHLDGLADVADGLGSGRRGDEALVIMKQSDVGPFGVATLTLTLLVQVSALASLLAAGVGVPALLVALVASRATLSLACTPWFRAARPDGLGTVVAGSVWGLLVPLALTLAAGATMLGGGLLTGLDLVGEAALGRLLLLAPLAAVPGLLLARHCARRFGGITGDVYGAVVETSFTASLVIAALAA
jgi:adenosylcobinamide-GDP ribazoletransferase